ncbi:MAG: CxxC-x17-CxxC domain-containing protein [Patescibacteria group bacterium]
MAFQSDRQMYDVNIACAECGTMITQLPFQPSGDRPVYCTNCLRNRRPARTSGGFGGGSRPPRQMYDVDVTCAQCGVRITQLPFQPSGDRPVYCMDCNRARRA